MSFSVAASILILGVGNVLLGDEGVGVHAARQLAGEPWPANVRVADGGTGGFHLLSFFEENDVLVMIDAAMDGRPPGTVTVLEPRFAADFPKSLSAHDIGLRDLVESAALLQYAPKIYLVTISVTAVQPMQMELTPEIAAALPGVADIVRQIVATASSG